MHNILTPAELKRRGMAAVEEGLKRGGPLRIVKRNRPAVVILTETEYQRLAAAREDPPARSGALEWLLSQPSLVTRDKQEIDAALAAQRQW